MGSHKILEALKSAGLVGTKLIPAVFEPWATIHVKYHDAEVQLGNTLTVKQIQKEPKVHWYLDVRGASPTLHLLTLVMLDPGAPSQDDPSRGPWLHWAQSGLFSDGGPQHPSLAPYAPPAPPKGTGRHRYIFLLYQEPLPEQVKKPGVELPGEQLVRASFDIAEFVSFNKLNLISADFFYCEAED